MLVYLTFAHPKTYSSIRHYSSCMFLCVPALTPGSISIVSSKAICVTAISSKENMYQPLIQVTVRTYVGNRTQDMWKPEEHPEEVTGN
jgi:hypothetical protein